MIFADRHDLATKNGDVAQLQKRIAEEPVGRDILAELFDLPLPGRHAFEPRGRRDHAEQHLQLGDFRNRRLKKERGTIRIQAGCQPVNHHVVTRIANGLRIGEARRVGVQVGDFKVGVRRVAIGHPLLQGADQVTEVQLARRTHARHHARALVRFMLHAYCI